MNRRCRCPSAAILVSLLCAWSWPLAARAGLAPLKQARGGLHVEKRSALQALSDSVHYRILPDRIEIEQRLVLKNTGPGRRHLLGLPLPADRLRGPQDPVVALIQDGREETLPAKRMKPFGWRPVAGWLRVWARIDPGQEVEIRTRWWQPHQVGELAGYPRFVITDPLWTSGGFAGPVGRMRRQVTFQGGSVYSDSRPDTQPLERAIGAEALSEQDRAWSATEHEPDEQALFSLYYKLKRAAFSRCADADPWRALDGDPATVWNPKACPKGAVAVEINALCRGVGTTEPLCDQALQTTFDLGLSVRSKDGRGREPIAVEGYWGPHRRWRKTGRRNRILPIGERRPLTRYRIVFPRGIPEAGAGEIQLARLDLTASDPGVVRLLRGRGWQKANARCRFDLAFRNPIPLRHASLRLNPKSKLDAYMISVDCADGRRRVPFHEPVPCNHTKAELAEARARLGEPDLQEFHHQHFKRKHRYRIELDLDPSCLVEAMRVVAPPVCSERFRPPIPQLRLDY